MKSKKHKHGFKVPKGYFQNFEEQLFAKIEEKQLPQQSGFQVPSDYFKKVEETIMKRLIVSKNPPKVINLFSRRTIGYAAAIAACAILIFSIINHTTTNFNNIKTASIENYINDRNIDIDSYDVMGLLNDTEINDISFGTQLFSDKNLEEYLLENMDDTTFLNE